MFSCELCEFKSAKQQYLKLHIRSVHEKKFKCVECDYMVTNKEDLKEHQKKNHKEKLRNCSLCAFSSTRFAQVTRHFRHVHKKFKKFECLKCDYRTRDRHTLTRHTNAIHNDNSRSIKCDLCEYSCSSFAGLRKHKKKHFELNCVMCSYECFYQLLLMEHVKREHKKDVMEEYKKELETKCCKCDFVSSGEKQIEAHLRMVHGEAIYICPICLYYSAFKTDLKRHLERIHDEKFLIRDIVANIKKNYSDK